MSTLNVTNISDGTNSTATTNVVKGSAKAWVNFDGTGTVAIREAYNVGSITDNGTGDYTVNFTTAMPDANYGFLSNAGSSNGTSDISTSYPFTITTSSARLRTISLPSSLVDRETVNVAIFR